MEALEKPVIAAMHGYCYGLGLELALAADFRIAAEGTQIALQEVELGLIPDVGGTTRLTRTVATCSGATSTTRTRSRRTSRAPWWWRDPGSW